MNRFKKLLLVLPSSFLVVSAMSPVLVRAHDGESGDDTTSSETEDHSGPGGRLSPEQRNRIEMHRHILQQRIHNQENEDENNDQEQEFERHNKSRADDILSELFHGEKKHSSEERKMRCENAEHGLENKLKNMQQNTKRHLELLGTFVTKALDYQAKHNLNPEGFDALLSAATAAQLEASAAVDALASLTVDINCDDGGVAKEVATFKAAAEQVHDSMKAYKKAIRNIFEALIKASEETNSNDLEN